MVNVYEKFEQSFTIAGTTATNFQKPYDASAPAGITNNGISVDAQFQPPGAADWSTAITHPCVYVAPQTLATISTNQQALPTTGQTGTWKVKWACKNPAQTGTWNWRIRVVDGNGTAYQAQSPFTVTVPTKKGFVKLSAAALSRFEYSDGSDFKGVGLNDNPASTLASKYTGIGLDWLRIWFSNLLPVGGGSGDNTITPWTPLNASNFITPVPGGGAVPFGIHLTGGANTSAVFTHGSSSATTQAFTSCKRSTQYRVSADIITSGLSGTGKVTIKAAGYADATTVTSVLAAVGSPIITTTAGSAPTTLTTFTGLVTTGASDDFFPAGGPPASQYVYIALEGSTTGNAYVTNLKFQEVLAGPTYGPNQWDTANGSLDTFSQAGSAIIDSLVADCESKGITIKAVLEDKGEAAWQYLNATGTTAAAATGDLGNTVALTMSGSTVTAQVSGTTSGLTAGATWVSVAGSVFGFSGQYLVQSVIDGTRFTYTSAQSNQVAGSLPAITVSNYYNDLTNSQTGWYHKALLRYICARWGYSSAIHSWEHLNEGDGGAAQQTFTNQWAAYLKSIDVHGHPVTTSTGVGVKTAFWAGMPNVDYCDTHGYNDTGELSGKDWTLPQGSWTWVTDGTYPGAIQMDCTTTQSWYLPFACQEAGAWTVSCDVWAQTVTGGSFGFSGEGMSQLLAAGTVGWTSVSQTFTPTLVNGQYTANLLLGAGTHTGGTGKIRNLRIVSPSGKRLYTLLGDGSFPQQTDTTRDVAAFHTSYDHYLSGNPAGYPSNVGEGLYGKPMAWGEWSPGTAVSPANTYAAWVASDTNLVWLHTFLFAGLAPGGVYPLWWNLAANPIDANNGWGKFLPYRNFVDLLPLNNGNYRDIAATPSGQTNGTVIVVGQKDAVNNKAHLWVRHANFTGYNAVNAPTSWLPGGVAGQILTGTVAFSGLANGPYTATVTEFSAAGVQSASSQSVTVSAGSGSINLAALASTTTDAAVSLAPSTGPQHVFIRM